MRDCVAYIDHLNKGITEYFCNNSCFPSLNIGYRSETVRSVSNMVGPDPERVFQIFHKSVHLCHLPGFNFPKQLISLYCDWSDLHYLNNMEN